MSNKILDLTPEQIKTIQDRFKANDVNQSQGDRLLGTIQTHIDNISYQVTINDENFTFIWSEFLKETCLGKEHLDHIKDQAIKKINAYDKGLTMYRKEES